MPFGKGGTGSIKNVGDYSSPFKIDQSPKQTGSDSIMGMRGSDSGSTLKPVVQVKVPPSTGGDGGVQNVGQLDPGARPLK